MCDWVCVASVDKGTGAEVVEEEEEEWLGAEVRGPVEEEVVEVEGDGEEEGRVELR